MVSEEAGKVTHAKDYEFVLPSGRKLSGLIVKSEKNKSTLTLLVHGWLDNSASFTDLLQALGGEIGTAIAVDLAGHGRSDHLPPDGHYIIMQYALDIMAMLKSLSPSFSEIRLVGHSLGAGLCILVERSCMCKLSSLVLLEGIGPMSSEDGTLGLQSIVSGLSLDPAEVRSYPTLKAAAMKRAESNIGGRMELSEAMTLTTRGTTRNSDGTFSFTHDRRLMSRSLMFLTESQVQSALRSVETPTLLVLDRGGLWKRLFDLLSSFRRSSIFVLTLVTRLILYFATLMPFIDRRLTVPAYNSCCRFGGIHKRLLKVVITNEKEKDKYRRGHHPHLGKDKGVATALIMKEFWQGECWGKTRGWQRR